MNKFDAKIEFPKDKSYSKESMYLGFHVNAGYVTKGGDVACVERRALAKLIEQVQYIKGIPGYRWNAIHIRFTVVSKLNQSLLGEDEAARGGDLVIRSVKSAIEKKNKKAIIHYRWHLEWSVSAGWHYHVAFFTNGSTLKGVNALLAEFHNQKVASVEAINPSLSKIREGEALDYFLAGGLAFDESIKFLPLHQDIDFEFVIYWFSYMTKRATKDYPSRSKIKSTGGTTTGRKKKPLKALHKPSDASGTLGIKSSRTARRKRLNRI